MRFLFGFLVLFGFLYAVFYAWKSEKKRFNNRVCDNCGSVFRFFTKDSQGGRGYTCDQCGHTVWVSYPFIDNNFKGDLNGNKIT